MDELQYLKFQEKTATKTAANNDYTSSGHNSILELQRQEQSKNSFLCFAVLAVGVFIAMKV